MFIFTGVLYCMWTYTFQFCSQSLGKALLFCFLISQHFTVHPQLQAKVWHSLLDLTITPPKNEYLYLLFVYILSYLLLLHFFFYNLSILFSWEFIGIVYWIWGMNVHYEKWRMFWYLRKPSPWNPSGICPKVAYAEQVGWWEARRKEQQPWPWRHRVWGWDWERTSGHSVLVKHPES